MLKLLPCEQTSGHLALPLYPKEPSLNPAEVYILYSKNGSKIIKIPRKELLILIFQIVSYTFIYLHFEV